MIKFQEKGNTNVCEKCKPTVLEQEDNALKSCDENYEAIKTCMLKKKGSIADCKNEWSLFRICFENQKKK